MDLQERAVTKSHAVLVVSLVAVVSLIAVLVTETSVSAQSSYLGANTNPDDAKIIPPAPDAIGGGNPFQGLGRSDESAPSRRSQFEADPAGASNPPAGSVNPNVPPDLPPAPTTDPIELQREKEEKERELEAQKKAEEKEREKENGSKSSSSTLAADTPLKKAMLEMQLRNYDQSLSQLNEIIATTPKSAEAHYLKAVIYVLTRKYEAAATEYHLVLKNDPSPTLSRKARAGLVKLAR
ncbi:MAG: hypothetical protein JST89_11380 [Cyanobacteria bacterium SZAS-4]|nr:hypothetical protein [Cyanobacteria bacterium SZAS-4]